MGADESKTYKWKVRDIEIRITEENGKTADCAFVKGSSFNQEQLSELSAYAGIAAAQLRDNERAAPTIVAEREPMVQVTVQNVSIPGSNKFNHRADRWNVSPEGLLTIYRIEDDRSKEVVTYAPNRWLSVAFA